MASGEVVERAECGRCGMWEECTLEYIGWVRARFGGVWVCGLCEEAIKDERARLGGGVEVAPRVHATFREIANAGPQSIVQLIKKFMSSTSSSPNKGFFAVILTLMVLVRKLKGELAIILTMRKLLCDLDMIESQLFNRFLLMFLRFKLLLGITRFPRS